MASRRIGVVLDSLTPPAWTERVLRELRADIAAVAIVPAPPVAAPWWLRAYDAFDARIAGDTPDPLAPVETRALLDGIPVRADLAGRDLDVILQLGPLPAAGTARYGSWVLACGEVQPALPPATWEVLTRTPVIRSALVATLPGGTTRTLYASTTATDPRSARRTRAAVFAKSVAFFGRALRDLDGAPRDAAAAPPVPQITVARALAGFAGAVARDRVERALGRKQWLLAYGIDPAGGDVPTRDLARLQRIVPPRDRFWADPFVVPHGDGWAIILEERLFARRNAHISVLPVARDGTLGEVVPVLERDYHLSYPFVFAWNGAWWMIPESARNRTIELWRATELPWRWTLERVLFEGIEAGDATVFEHGGMWWLACTIAEPGASKDDELHLFHAATPLGPWRPHAKNPVKSAVRGARPAGRPFQVDGAWLRPAQDGSHGYGGAIVLQRIDALDPETYRETEVDRLAPDWDPALVGLHTINAAAGLTVIDLRIRRSRWSRA